MHAGCNWLLPKQQHSYLNQCHLLAGLQLADSGFLFVPPLRLEIRHSPVEAPVSGCAPPERFVLGTTNLASLGVGVAFEFRAGTSSNIRM